MRKKQSVIGQGDAPTPRNYPPRKWIDEVLTSDMEELHSIAVWSADDNQELVSSLQANEEKLTPETRQVFWSLTTTLTLLKWFAERAEETTRDNRTALLYLYDTMKGNRQVSLRVPRQVGKELNEWMRERERQKKAMREYVR